jgi:hypothetical protein
VYIICSEPLRVQSPVASTKAHVAEARYRLFPLGRLVRYGNEWIVAGCYFHFNCELYLNFNSLDLHLMRVCINDERNVPCLSEYSYIFNGLHLGRYSVDMVSSVPILINNIGINFLNE